MEGDERGAAAGIAFIRAAAAAVHPDLAPVKHGMIDLDAYPDIVIEGGAAWRADSPDARGTCQIDGDMATVEIADPSPYALGWIERLTIRRSVGGRDTLSGTLHSVAPGDRGVHVANDDDDRSELDLAFCDPCTLIRKSRGADHVA